MDSNPKKTMRAVQALEKGKIELVEVPIPEPEWGQVLIKVESAPIQPLDEIIANGNFKKKTFPIPVGFEGSGTVVENGGGLTGWKLKGKKVAFMTFTYGSWAEYVVCDAMKEVLAFDSSVTYDECACAMGNPFSALALVDTTKEGKFKGVILNAANSAIGRMLIKCFALEKIPTIAIIRKDQQKQGLLDIGATEVLNSTDSDFLEKVKTLSEKYSATVFWDCVGDDLSGKILRAMPNSSTTFCYGFQSGNPLVGYDMGDTMLNNKQIKTFTVDDWLPTVGLFKIISCVKRLEKEVKTTFETKIIKTFPLDQWKEAWEYSRKNCSEGKVLLKPRQ